MVKVKHDSAELLVRQLMNGGVRVIMPDEKNRGITLRIPENLGERIDKLVEETQGWSRNLVATFLLEIGLEVIDFECLQLRQEDDEHFVETGGESR